MKDAIISNCLLWFCCIPSINAVSFLPCFSMDSRLFLMETASSSPTSSVGAFLFLVRFLSFRHCLLGPARLISGIRDFIAGPTGATRSNATFWRTWRSARAWLRATMITWRVCAQRRRRSGACPCFDHVFHGNNISCSKNSVYFVVENTFTYVTSRLTLVP